MKYFSRLVVVVVVVELKGIGFHLALIFSASLSEVENGVKPCPNLQNFLEDSDQADLLHRGRQGLRWKLDACAL